MKLTEGRIKFIETWGDLSYSWGVSKSMAQMHALLLISPKPMCAKAIQDTLDISMGSTNNNLRALQDWNLIYKVQSESSRKDYFVAEKDIWEVFKRILQKRKERELVPLIGVLDDLVSVESNCKESAEFCKVVKDIKQFANTADSALDNLVKSESNWILNTWMHIIR